MFWRRWSSHSERKGYPSSTMPSLVSAATCPNRPTGGFNAARTLGHGVTRETDGAAAGLDEVSATGTLLPLPDRVRDRRRRPLGLGAKALAAIFAAVDTGASLFAGQPADCRGRCSLPGGVRETTK